MQKIFPRFVVYFRRKPSYSKMKNTSLLPSSEWQVTKEKEKQSKLKLNGLLNWTEVFLWSELGWLLAEKHKIVSPPVSSVLRFFPKRKAKRLLHFGLALRFLGSLSWKTVNYASKFSYLILYASSGKAFEIEVSGIRLNKVSESYLSKDG